jgi:thiamine biosynthesis lipoprotein
MATTFRISCYAADRAVAEKAADACFARIAGLNQIFTDYDPTSELMRLCAPDAMYPMAVSPAMLDLLHRSIELARITDGAFDPTCGHLSQLWRRARRQGKLPPTERLQSAIAATDWQRITLDKNSSQASLQPGTLLDLGAVIQAGGDTAVGDAPPGKPGWEIKLRTFSGPGDEDSLTTLVLANRAVSTSGDLYQYTEIAGIRYSHIISPKTGLGLTERIACSVIAPDCTSSDALATAMCVLGQEQGKKLAATLPDVEVRFTTAR